MIAERPLVGHGLGRVDVPLEHEVGIGRHLQIDGLASDRRDGLFSQESGEHPLVDAIGQRGGGRVGHRGIAAERHGHIDTSKPELARPPQVTGAGLVDLPVHRGGAAIELLHPVAADVADAGLGIPSDYLRQRDERSPVRRPAGEDGQRVQIDLVASRYDLLAGTLRDAPGWDVGELGQLHGELGELARAGGSLAVYEISDGPCVLLEIFDTQGHGHAPA